MIEPSELVLCWGDSQDHHDVLLNKGSRRRWSDVFINIAQPYYNYYTFLCLTWSRVSMLWIRLSFFHANRSNHLTKWCCNIWICLCSHCTHSLICSTDVVLVFISTKEILLLFYHCCVPLVSALIRSQVLFSSFSQIIFLSSMWETLQID